MNPFYRQELSVTGDKLDLNPKMVDYMDTFKNSLAPAPQQPQWGGYTQPPTTPSMSPNTRRRVPRAY